ADDRPVQDDGQAPVLVLPHPLPAEERVGVLHPAEQAPVRGHRPIMHGAGPARGQHDRSTVASGGGPATSETRPDQGTGRNGTVNVVGALCVDSLPAGSTATTVTV